MAIKDVVQLGFGASGSIARIVMLGFGGGQQGPLVGQWSRVTYLQASAPRVGLQAKHTPATLEASDAHNNH